MRLWVHSLRELERDKVDIRFFPQRYRYSTPRDEHSPIEFRVAIQLIRVLDIRAQRQYAIESKVHTIKSSLRSLLTASACHSLATHSMSTYSPRIWLHCMSVKIHYYLSSLGAGKTFCSVFFPGHLLAPCRIKLLCSTAIMYCQPIYHVFFSLCKFYDFHSTWNGQSYHLSHLIYFRSFQTIENDFSAQRNGWMRRN